MRIRMNEQQTDHMVVIIMMTIINKQTNQTIGRERERERERKWRELIKQINKQTNERIKVE